MDKWLGESQKLVRSLFSVARKFAPSIIFIDEVDLFLRQRASSDHEATAQIKSEFMTLVRSDALPASTRTQSLWFRSGMV